MVKEFPLSPLEKILKETGKEAGADRVATSAVKELRSVLLEMSERLATEAIVATHHAKRVTVKREDVIMAKR